MTRADNQKRVDKLLKSKAMTATEYYCDWNDITLEDLGDGDRLIIKCMESYVQEQRKEQRLECHNHHVKIFGKTHCADVILETPLVTTKTDK